MRLTNPDSGNRTLLRCLFLDWRDWSSAFVLFFLCKGLVCAALLGGLRLGSFSSMGSSGFVALLLQRIFWEREHESLAWAGIHTIVICVWM